MIATTIMSSINVKPRWLLTPASFTNPDTGLMVDIRMFAGVARLSLLPHGVDYRCSRCGIELSPFADGMSAAVITGKSVNCVPVYGR